MADYFSEYSSFVGAKGLPSPVDTPYETPSFIRSKRSSRATAGGSSREHSASPPPLPPDATELSGRLSAVDPRRFTPTLHASLVSEILNLRRELEQKNNLVENIETRLSDAHTENEALGNKLAEREWDVKRQRQAIAQIEKTTMEAMEDLVKERDAVKTSNDDFRIKLESLQKKVRQQDEEAERTQSIWESEREGAEKDRRQLERKLHVTESRLRAFVDEITAQQGALQGHTVQVDEPSDGSVFKDSAIGNESDTTSIHSMTPIKHTRNMSSVSMQPRTLRSSVSSRTLGTPEPVRNGHSLADELGIDEEDEFDDDEFIDDDLDHADQARGAVESRQSARAEHIETPKRMRETKTELGSPAHRHSAKNSLDSNGVKGISTQTLQLVSALQPAIVDVKPATRVVYVDSGYQPSPPSSPPRVEITKYDSEIPVSQDAISSEVGLGELQARQLPASDSSPKIASSSPISPPQTPVVDDDTWTGQPHVPSIRSNYTESSTQTDAGQTEVTKGHTRKHDSLSPPMFVPAIAIHPPSSRPSSPRPYVLPPGTKNASCQAELPWSCKDAMVQTEEIRVDRRLLKLPPMPTPSPALLPSPTFPEPAIRAKRMTAGPGMAKIFTKLPQVGDTPISPPIQSPAESSPENTRRSHSRDLRTKPLKAILLPTPVLSPPAPTGDSLNNGPLNRAAQYGVTQPRRRDRQSFADDIDNWSDHSDHDDLVTDVEPKDLAGNMPGAIRPPQGRFGLSEPPKTVPENKEISPERRPDTADSYGAAPAPSISSSRATSQPQRQASKRTSKAKDFRSRSPSFGSAISSNYSAQSGVPMPPYPIPLRSSSRHPTKPHSEGSHSPTPHHRSARHQAATQASLRKVQSAAVIRNRSGRTSPSKIRRRRRSPELTPVQSMAFESPPVPTDFPIPELPTPLQDGMAHEHPRGSVKSSIKGSTDLSKHATSASISAIAEETNLVDAIAATMVGEWMWKYIRKRKSFGIGDDNAEVPVTDQNGIVNIQAHGTRHKRWVWLSPYERTIMWDTKQPTSGNALLGKKGRKLPIQSVLDVQDTSPLPKTPELASAFGRSILILTPERALKFTAVNQERHLLWMTALLFLSQSSQLPGIIPQVPSKLQPPPLPVEAAPAPRQRAPSFGRSNVRDSIRLAKGKRPDFTNSYASDKLLGTSSSNPQQSHVQQPTFASMTAQDDGADFPSVPRLYSGTVKHQRKRSNTIGSPRLPRSFSSTAVTAPPSASSALHPTTSFRPSASSKSGSRQDSNSMERPNFFEAVGTVRMEAFVDPNVRDGVLYVPAPPPGAANGPNVRRRRGDSSLSQSTMDRRRAGYIFDEDGIDPFKGF